MKAIEPADGLAGELNDAVYIIVREQLENPDDPWVPESPKIWTALTAVDRSTGVEAVLAFPSPPSAIRFMKPAISHGFLSEGGKIAKYPRRVAETWDFFLLISPSPDDLATLRRDFEFPGPGIVVD